ncbi:aquaporin NIP1-1-like [Magnolia sinica]|uniref:aquaporin NIP1-1-like n=1 Tax=Magnolia sinica TaxID=86752 RepID=UPI00265AD747|nr:aquaporin NIP1-1-like [Magnolia sinica]
MAEMPPSPIGLSPNPPQTSELSILEEGKSIPHSPPQEPVVEADASSSNLHKIIAEIVGTYILIFVGCGSALVDKKYHLSTVGVAVAWGLVVMVMVYSLGHISGAQLNPAVTIALAAARKFPWKKILK